MEILTQRPEDSPARYIPELIYHKTKWFPDERGLKDIVLLSINLIMSTC